MNDQKTMRIFDNAVPENVTRKALKNQKKFIKKFGDDRNNEYHLAPADTPAIGKIFNVKNLVSSKEPLEELAENPVIIGNIRMGFGHYRISMAMASCAHAMGFNPYWMDLHSYQDATCGKIIHYQNELYSMGSRWSQKYPLFNKLYWEPLNSEGFRKLSYNASDLAAAELMTTVYHDLPKDIPYIATHVWPAQAAIAAGMTHVVNAIPDNWPMALHLAPGSTHTVQTRSAYLGYRLLRGMDGHNTLNPMPADSVIYTGHYIDHELVSNVESDCLARMNRNNSDKPLRLLLTIGGAGAQTELFCSILKHLIPAVSSGRVTLFVNVGDHRGVWDSLLLHLPELCAFTTEHIDNHAEAAAFVNNLLNANQNSSKTPGGIHLFCNKDIFSAVYMTNLLMRVSDLLITKPSELAFYPIPKLMIHRVGGHEAWGAIHASELGDGTYECEHTPEVLGMLDALLSEPDLLNSMCEQIISLKKQGVYNGAYKAVELAVGHNSLI